MMISTIASYYADHLYRKKDMEMHFSRINQRLILFQIKQLYQVLANTILKEASQYNLRAKKDHQLLYRLVQEEFPFQILYLEERSLALEITLSLILVIQDLLS